MLLGLFKWLSKRDLESETGDIRVNVLIFLIEALNLMAKAAHMLSQSWNLCYVVEDYYLNEGVVLSPIRQNT